MSEVGKKLKYMRQMRNGVKPKEYCQDEENKKYKSRQEAYNAIISVLSSCDEREVDNMEIMLNCEIGTANRMLEFRGVFTLYISIISLIISSASMFLTKIFELKMKEDEIQATVQYLNSSMQSILACILMLAVGMIVVYLAISNCYSRKIDTATYLIGAIKKHREYMSENK